MGKMLIAGDDWLRNPVNTAIMIYGIQNWRERDYRLLTSEFLSTRYSFLLSATCVIQIWGHNQEIAIYLN
jgi:hypothetical protein